MTVIAVLVAAIIVLVCLFLVIYPFFKKNISMPVHQQLSAEDEQIDRKALLSTLNEIEFDYKMNKISEEDFKKLSKHYESLIYKQMQELENKQPVPVKAVPGGELSSLDDEIEREFAKYRKSKGGN